ncbi:MAG TPA: hypothetical protein VIA18_08410 [Polyangia bacterium]|nr:hypothetical protein [Polyangia bacterium]
MRRLVVAAALVVVAGAAGCRPDAGPNNYANQESFPDGGDVPLPGPDPYVPGTPRLNLGAFYEGQSSQTILIDNMTTHLYVYQVGMPPMNTANLLPDQDRVEGLTSTQIIDLGLGFVGLGINWDSPKDLSTWTNMHVSLKSKDSAYATLMLGIDSKTIYLDPTKYGYVNDGAWHNIVIPLADYVAAGVDLTMVDAPFVINAGAGVTGDSLLVDALFWTAD